MFPKLQQQPKVILLRRNWRTLQSSVIPPDTPGTGGDIPAGGALALTWGEGAGTLGVSTPPKNLWDTWDGLCGHAEQVLSSLL